MNEMKEYSAALKRIEQLFAMLYNDFMRGDMYVQR